MTTAPSAGELLKEWRESAGRRQDEVATAARVCGLAWTRDTVAAIEGGRRDFSLMEFLLLRGVPLKRDELAALFATTTEISATVGALQDAEVKAARKLGVRPEEVVATAVRLWGRTLSEERDRVLAENVKMDRTARECRTGRGQKSLPAARNRQAVRGHITRALVEQLRVELALATFNARPNAAQVVGDVPRALTALHDRIARFGGPDE